MATSFRSSFVLVLSVYFILQSFTCLAKQKEGQTNTSPRIAVIGGGIGGSSCSYFLRNLFGDQAEIDVYEPGELGGRLATVNMVGRNYDSGGTVIHPNNLYMQQFVQKLGLKHRDKPSGTKMGIYNGEEFVFIQSDWSVVTFTKMFWRYGYNLIKLNSMLKILLEKFSRIYDVQDKHGIAYTTVEGILQAMGGDEYVQHTKVMLSKLLKDDGYSDQFISEMVSIATRVNYGQSADMSAFAGLVSLAGVQGGLWSVYGGNKQVCQRLLVEAKASIYKKSHKWNQTRTEEQDTRLLFDN